MKTKNLDIRETSQDAQNASVKDVEHNRRGSNYFNSLCAPAAQPHHRPQRRYRIGGSRYITECRPPTSSKRFVLQNRLDSHWSRI